MTHPEDRYGTHELMHNPGYDFFRFVTWIADTDLEDTDSLPYAPYFYPVMGVLTACCTIEGYINMVGQHVDPKWNEFDKGPRPIKDRVSRIYRHLGKDIQFGQGIWQEVLTLFRARISLVHPRFVNKVEERVGKIPIVFDEIMSEFPPEKSKQIAETVMNLLLSDSGVDEATHCWSFHY